MRYDLFVSYSRNDSRRAQPLVDELRRLGYRVFFDIETIRVGERWKERLEAGVRASRALILCWSSSAKASEFVQFEYTRAEGLGKRVFPWLLDQTPLPAMVELQAITESDPAAVSGTVARAIGWSLTRRRWLAAGGGSVAGLAACMAWAAFARREAPAAWFAGTVSDTDQNPIAEVEVSVGRIAAHSDAEGRFSLRLPGEGRDWVLARFRKEGYREETTNAPTGGSFRMTLVKSKQDAPQQPR